MNNTPNTKLLLTIEEVAELLQVKISWIYDHISRIKPIIPHVRVGGQIRFKREAILSFIDEHSVVC